MRTPSLTKPPEVVDAEEADGDKHGTLTFTISESDENNMETNTPDLKRLHEAREAEKAPKTNNHDNYIDNNAIFKGDGNGSSITSNFNASTTNHHKGSKSGAEKSKSGSNSGAEKTKSDSKSGGEKNKIDSKSGGEKNKSDSNSGDRRNDHTNDKHHDNHIRNRGTFIGKGSGSTIGGDFDASTTNYH